jgi:LacI family transcriptional regulator
LEVYNHEGFRQVVDEHHLPFPNEYNQLAPYDIQGAREQARHLLSLPDRPNGIFAATDLQAMGVLKACQDLGLRVPQDVAVIGFDDLEFSSYIGLTTIRQPLDESGRVAVELLLARFADRDRPLQHVRLPLTVVERDTA